MQILENLAKSKGLFLFFVTGKSPNWSNLKEKIKNLPGVSLSAQSKWSLYITPSYERLFPELIKDCQTNFQSQLNTTEINQNTIQHFSKLWTHNYLKNRIGLFSNKTSFQWFQSFSGEKTSVLFLGASPGLELDLPTIQKERDNFLIFASDTALGYLLPNGVIPDYIVSFDSGRGTTYHFLLDLPKYIPIITWLGGASYIFDLANPKILVNTGHPLDQIVEHLFQTGLGKKWPHYSNPSLNLLGMVESITESIENRKFFVSGVSYLAERGKSHCKGTGYERYYLPDISRKKSLELTTKRLYSGERKGKNQTAWEQMNKKDSFSGIQFLSEAKEISFPSIKNQGHSVKTFQGFPPSLAELAKWANQDHSGIIHRKTLNTWLRFSLS
ncbi:6-hydroxymethylpterin diphosphokinase MptE-like protein [Leptospira congkakensis]|nr:6-hydroxymethylpterin diphosphokinase MptE-like protein [Leptospira congkakensis]